MPQTLPQKLEAMRNYFNGGATKSLAFRKMQLQKLKDAVLQHEEDLYDALYADLKKSKEETWVTETGFFIAEINDAIRNLHKWMKPEKVKTNLLNMPSSSYVINEPLGVVLVIGPWNYPLQLLFTPIIGAIAAGNCVVVKPSEFAQATLNVMKEIITKTFDENYVLFVEGDGAAVVPEMMNNFVFDHVFYTGSTMVGKVIYQMAAKNLVPVTLELGGKSPCIVESDANIEVAARRIVLTKFSNCGQMCVAPDYLLVHTSVKEKLVEALKKWIEKFYTTDPLTAYSYGKIINEKQFNRLLGYLQNANIICGGTHDASKLFITPTLIDHVDLSLPVMQDEIFGPILPVITFNTKEEALKIITQHKNPLALYVFTQSNTKEREWLDSVAFGGGCVNNASWHLTNYHLPFGGRGFSGTGAYHGKFSFNTFSHKKAIMKTPTWFDPDIKYPPFKGKLKLFKWVIK
ncbi:aldehyde dehydrogenase [Panacibacter ginsenosidivorans]|uniref:Aldehyde dehydrogenase n=1 Tax=Panacibacter ginsenosidivorans TaxID=1813871 RepID=A0A5B8VA90_9BACT|nr:aldehyde dehydrogenase [Panacibacter ginsenosidivorans]QEC67616.1 aldehyde dehydrogenase [Panacibacter ginsenosidivorans]